MVSETTARVDAAKLEVADWKKDRRSRYVLDTAAAVEKRRSGASHQRTNRLLSREEKRVRATHSRENAQTDRGGAQLRADGTNARTNDTVAQRQRARDISILLVNSA